MNQTIESMHLFATLFRGMNSNGGGSIRLTTSARCSKGYNSFRLDESLPILAALKSRKDEKPSFRFQGCEILCSDR